MRNPSNIILIGFMGCGKTTTASLLSRRLQTLLADTDQLIERSEGRSVSAIFAEKGEDYFRELETACLERLIEEKKRQSAGLVLSVGGGLPMRERNRELLAQLGRVFYLRIRPESVCERLREDTTRPLLQGDEESPRERVERLLNQRGPYYEAAAGDIIDVDGKSAGEIVEEIVDRISLGKG